MGSVEAMIRRPPGRCRRLVIYSDATNWGGAEIVLVGLLAGLRADIEVAVVGVDRTVVDRLASARAGTAAVVLPTIRNKRGVAAMWAHRRAFARLRPDVLHVQLQAPGAAQFVVPIAATLPRLRIIAVEELPMPIRLASGRWLKRFSDRLLAAHVAAGDRAGREVEHMAGLRPGSIRTIYNGVREPAPAGPPATPAADVIGTVVRLVPQKGVDVLLRALAELPEVRLEIVGDGPDRAELERLAASLEVADRVTWHGWCEDPREVRRSWVGFVLPSRFEGFPLTIVEAMLDEVPVVVTDVGSSAEAVQPGVTGWLVAADDVAGLAAALRELLSDPAERARRASNAARRARAEFTADEMARRYEALYDEVLAR